MIALIAACGGEWYSLPSVPLIGGTEGQRVAARVELESFDALVGVERVVARSVEFSDRLPSWADGRTSAGRVELASWLEPETVDWTLRHELCHVLDGAEELSPERADVLRSLLPSLLGEGPAWSHLDDGDDEVEEAFAQVCDDSPAILPWLETSTDPELRELGAWLDLEVWSGEPVSWIVVPAPAWTEQDERE